MPNYLVDDDIWLIGAGNMAAEYIKVLKGQLRAFKVIGRGQESAKNLMTKLNINVLTGGLNNAISSLKKIPSKAIVAVNTDQLFSTTKELLEIGVKDILVEKPAGINLDQIKELALIAEKNNSKVYVAYNRRFYSSVKEAMKIIKDDGGVLSFCFEFTEWSHIIEKIKKHPEEKSKWFLANSTHVVDLAFFIGGIPKDLNVFYSRGLSWHPSASVFSGAGITETGAVFSYHSNWESPGRWRLEIFTKKHRLVFLPLEQLHIQKIGSLELKKINLNDQLDIKYKPGLFMQVNAFLNNEVGNLLNISHHYELSLKYYAKIANYEI
ncbi:Gfo/Idh/MocA family oxidoreductase [Cytobacillus oceanisediminis]|uniref:Gfo/Idh/MocA family protein n=1 Tax=Cytobacillus oceanisediminis TaxID=665099 RepID=UPI001D13D9F0|nr:Gfo/Idh/MocA family oxidoreductase [Cytobacillus oceanisediminis]MCC3646341.1 Gfo/Idh/MocA family oxidoreductase [Cytobacillus oceanisediminis]